MVGTLETSLLVALKESESKEACEAYRALLRYMGDLPKKNASDVQLVQEIISRGIRYADLRNEIILQIYKQTGEE